MSTWRWKQERGSKYGAKSTVYDGIAYHSKKEAGYAAELDLRKKGGDIKDWKRQVRISLDVNGHHICNYYVDFEIEHNNGDRELVEVKGFQTEIFRLKRKLFEATYLKDNPEVAYTMIT